MQNMCLEKLFLVKNSFSEKGWCIFLGGGVEGLGD